MVVADVSALEQGYEEYEQETQEWFASAVDSMAVVTRKCVGEGGGFDLGLISGMTMTSHVSWL